MIKNLFVKLFKYGVPFALIGSVLMIFYGFINPWAPSYEALAKYPNSISLLTSIKSNYKSSYEKHSKTYLIIKTNPLSSFTVKITTDSNGSNQVTERTGGFIFTLLHYLFLITITWWFWFKNKTHNKSLNQTGANNAPPG